MLCTGRRETIPGEIGPRPLCTREAAAPAPGVFTTHFPEHKPINRTYINTWEDSRVVDAVKKTGRKKVVMAALWTEICLAMPALHAMGEGYDVYVVTDASGGVSPEAHDMAVRRLVQAGAVPMTWLAVQAEWQRDWAREATVPGLAQVLAEHGGGSGVAFAWEMQLLQGKAGATG